MLEDEERGNDSREELKRADHLIYVSLKYTRTGDVILSVITRLMNAIELTMDEMLKWFEAKKKLKQVDYSKPYRIKVEWIRNKLKKDKAVNDMLDLYLFMLRIMKGEHDAKDEFRKGLRLISIDDKGGLIAEVNMDDVKEYYKRTEKFIERVEEIIK